MKTICYNLCSSLLTQNEVFSIFVTLPFAIILIIVGLFMSIKRKEINNLWISLAFAIATFMYDISKFFLVLYGVSGWNQIAISGLITLLAIYIANKIIQLKYELD